MSKLGFCLKHSTTWRVTYREGIMDTTWRLCKEENDDERGSERSSRRKVDQRGAAGGKGISEEQEEHEDE